MNKRILVFYTLAIIGIFIASFLQNMYNPAVPNADAAANSEQVAQNETDEPSNLASTDSTDPSENELGDQSTGGTPKSDENLAVGSIDTTNAKIESTEGNAPDAPVSKLYTIGSLDPESGSRYLITLDSLGGTVRRVELNYRTKKGEYKYRDLEFQGGYLGELDCHDSNGRCVVRIVGDGTPAQLAGIQPGDAIKSVDGEPVMEAADFVSILAKTKPGQTISVALIREGNSDDVQIQVALTDKPIELIRPQPDVLELGWVARPSFRTTLRQLSQGDVWPVLDENMKDGTWEVVEHDGDSISFAFNLDTVATEQTGDEGKTENVAGSIHVVKKYSLTGINAADFESDVTKDFHFNLDFSIENTGSNEQNFAYQLDGPLGTPTETWWYQNKIHGGKWAIGYGAGARDVIGSTAAEEFTFYGGPQIASNMLKTEPKYVWLVNPPSDDEAANQVNYLSVDTQYFNVALIPVESEEPFSAYSVLADIAVDPVPDEVKEQRLADCTFRMFKTLKLEPEQAYKQTFEIFAGPKEGPILASYELDDVRSFGWFSMFSKPLCWLLQVFHKLTFQLGYGIPIILLTMLVRCLMIPISRKAALNAQMMQYLQPQMKEIADKYKDDMEKRGQAQRDLFKKYKYNPFSGCVMMFFQLPIFIGLYRGLSVDIALRDQPLFPGMSWCSNLSAPDQLWYWKDTIPIDFLTSETGWLGPYFNILPIITCVLFIVQQKLFTPPPTDEQQEMMQKVMSYAMIFMGLLFFKVPAGLCLYFITSSVWGIAERKMLPKPELDKSKLDEEFGTDKASLAKKAKLDAKRQAKDQKRLEELDEKKRRDKERKQRLKKRNKPGDDE